MTDAKCHMVQNLPWQVCLSILTRSYSSTTLCNSVAQ